MEHSSGSAAGHWQVPPAQISFRRAHALPHVPQFFGSVARSAQRGFDVGHDVSGGAHTHAPALHVPFPHEIPQAPQLSRSVWYDAESRQKPWHFSCPEAQSSGFE